MRSRVKTWAGIRTRFWCLLVLAHFSKAQKTAPFLGLHFGAGEPLSSPFLEPRTERPFLQRCSWVTPNCSQLLLVLNTYQSSWNFLRSYQVQQQQGRPLWRTRFGRVFRSGNWARQIGQKLNYSAKKSAGRAQQPPEAHWVIQLIFVFRAMLSLGLAWEGLVCLRENVRTQGLRFQERVRQVNSGTRGEWFWKLAVGACIWGGIKTRYVYTGRYKSGGI